MELENRFILIAGFAGSSRWHRRINIYHNSKLDQVSLFTCGLSGAIMSIFTPKDVTYTFKLMELILPVQLTPFPIYPGLHVQM